MFALSVSAALCLTLLLLLPLALVIRRRSSFLRRPLPPGPWPWPVVGNLLYLALLERRLRQPPHTVLASVARIYGPLVHLRLGARSVIVASSPSAAKQILKERDRDTSGRYIPATYRISIYVAYSLAWAARCDDHWRWLRTLCKMEIFSSSRVEAHAALREETTKDMVELLRRRQGEEIKIGELAFRTVFNMLNGMIFSRGLLAADGEEGSGKGNTSSKLKKAMSEGLQMGMTPNLEDFYPAVFGGLDLQRLRRITRKNLDIIYDVMDGVITERRMELEEGACDEVGNRKADLLTVLLNAGCDDTQLKAFLLDLFTAGTDTSATLVEWTMSELIKNPCCMRLVREELQRVVDSPETSAAAVRESYLPRLSYLQACIKETLRLHPPVPMLLPHRAVDTCEVMGYEVPVDCTILVNVWAIGRDPEVWENPLQFQPERFLKGGGSPEFSRGMDFGFLPFGAGRRVCPGMQLASGHMLPLVLASMVHGFEWCLPGGMTADQLGMGEKLGLVLEREQPLVLVPTSTA